MEKDIRTDGVSVDRMVMNAGGPPITGLLYPVVDRTVVVLWSPETRGVTHVSGRSVGKRRVA